MDKLIQMLCNWVEDRRVPGAVVDIRMKGEQIFQAAFGSANLSTVYDVASLTKVVATLPSILILAQSSKLSLSDPVQKFIPEFRHPKVTIEHCLRHVSGLPASLPGYRERYTRRDVRQEILSQELAFEPGERMIYSDLGMILIGWIVSRVSGLSLDVFIKDRIFKQLGMEDSCFNPPPSWMNRIAPTEWDGKGYLLGEVHDETCYRLGGVSGSAGLFSTADDLSRYAQIWLYPESLSLLTRKSVDGCTQASIEGRGLGWQIQDGKQADLACGPLWPIGSFGHTGFTGTSLWIDPIRELSVVLLTNAVHYGRDSEIKQLRSIFHDAVMTSLIDKHCTTREEI
ncbi:serine hydrolase domain-containing protein [Cohnella abietis]|uniref:Esterase n=1 Tax=Cohnella abietis TaxID=2507935 RepID=A0A3T1DE96_9BACL|nr:serine hydrolase domain-containing protein [Cohnella abietis]BBI36486.1 esterase [Cohnella abietis]